MVCLLCFLHILKIERAINDDIRYFNFGLYWYKLIVELDVWVKLGLLDPGCGHSGTQFLG